MPRSWGVAMLTMKWTIMGEIVSYTSSEYMFSMDNKYSGSL